MNTKSMSSFPSYSRPPIIEAILDVQVDLPGDFNFSNLLKCQKNVKEDYPNNKVTQLMKVTGGYTPDKGISSSASATAMGQIFSSLDGSKLFQARLNGFAYNHLGKYPGWDQFFAEAKRLWEEYRSVTHPRGYKRIALRYINRFDFTDDLVKHESYFRTYLEVSQDLPQIIGNFFYQFDLPLEEIASCARIAQALVPPPENAQYSILLDIDLFRTEKLEDLGGLQVWELFETLRIWKNKVFNACITDAAREMIS